MKSSYKTSPYNLIIITFLIIILSACGGTQKVQPEPTTDPPTPSPTFLGLVEVTINGIGTPNPSSSARILTDESSTGESSTGLQGQSLKNLKAEQFVITMRSVNTFEANGKRYINANYGISNHSPSSVGSLNFVAVDHAQTLGTTPLKNILKLNGEPVAEADITKSNFQLAPYHRFNATTGQAELEYIQNDFVTFNAESLKGITLPEGVTALAMGYEAKGINRKNTRIFSDDAADATTFEGQVNFTTSYDVQGTSKDPFSFTFVFALTERQASSVSVKGNIWHDANGNNTKDAGEANLDRRIVFLDANNNGKLDRFEHRTSTDKDGNYSFSNVPLGEHIVRQVLPFGERNTFISSGSSSAARANNAIQHHSLQSQHLGDTMSRIVGGRDTDINKYPFMLALGSIEETDGKVTFRQFCGATLISDRFAVTAAHCVDGLPAQGTGTAVLSNTSKLDAPGTITKLKRIIMHPDYVDVIQGYDIAVLELEQPLALSGNTYTVALVDEQHRHWTNDGVVATITGWGALASGGQAANHLQVVHTKIMNAADCENAYKAAGTDVENFATQICAGVPEGGIDGCQGDSGGPLFVRAVLNGQSQWFHAGATSWGVGCAVPGLAGVWARTSLFEPWIKEQSREISQAHRIKVVAGQDITGLDFANQSTLRPMIGDIPARWQITNFSNTSAKGIFVEANKALNFEWNIFAETQDFTYTCNLSMKKLVSNATATTQSLPCKLGRNVYDLAEGIAKDSYEVGLTITADGLSYQRKLNLATVASVVSGELTTSDYVLDPNEVGNVTVYMDYYEVLGVDVGDTVFIQMDSNDFESYYIFLFDKATKTKPESISTASTYVEGLLSLEIEKDKNYVIGVTSAEDKGTGAYTLTLSKGSLQPFTFPKQSAQ